MPYCVRCGVELPQAATRCPLCDTPVVLPPELLKDKDSQTDDTQKLFPCEVVAPYSHALDKKRKGAFELLTGLTIVTEIVLAVSLIPSSYGWFIPMFSVLIGALCCAAVLILPTTYGWLASSVCALTTLFIGVLGVRLGGVRWPIITCASVCLGWIWFVFPFCLSMRYRWIAAICQFVSVLGFLYLLDTLIDGGRSWFLPVAVPVVAVLCVMAGILAVRIKFSRQKDFPLADLVLSICCIVSITVGTGDVFAVRFMTGRWGLGWSLPVWVFALGICAFLVLVGVSRRLRRYFNSQVRHS